MKTLYTTKASSEIPKDFFVFDVETKINKDGKDYWGLSARPDSFVFGVVYGHNYCKRINSVREFKEEFLTERYKDKIVFAHNAEYDLGTLFDNIYIEDDEAIFNGKFICMTNGNCRFADSMNIYSFGVKKIGELTGDLKGTALQEEIDLKKPIEYPISQRIVDYCISDCRIVYNALLEFFCMTGRIKITQASLAMDYFRSYHMKNHIKYDEILQKYFYNSYYGGRTEAFKIGPTNSKVYDVNSMYPHAMVNCVFPSPSRLKRSSRCSVKELKSRIAFNEGCCKINVTHREHFFGFLPYRHDKKLVFPVGTFTTWVNFNELRFALKHKVIKINEVHEVIYSRPSKSPFISFIKDLYTRRKETNNPLRKIIYKLLMNSLYGKFAQKLDEEFIYIRDSVRYGEKIFEAIKKKTFIKLQPFSEKRDDCFLIRKAERGTTAWTIPSFASYITSYARIQLLEFMLENQHNRITYCDTDSAFMEIDPQLPHTKELGEWCPEEKEVTYISGLKNYEYKNPDGTYGKKLKGVPRTAKKIAENVYEFYNLIKTREALIRKMDAGVLTRRIKVISGKYTKRKVSPDGNTEPLKF